MITLILALYSLAAFVSFLNLLLMRRPGRARQGATFCILIPARNEAKNLSELVPQLLAPSQHAENGPKIKVYVYDDDSTDETAKAAAQAGAIVIKGGALPEGWKGKNHACHQLALAATEDGADWLLFLDADVRVQPDFMDAMRHLTGWAGTRIPVISAFPKILPGRGLEPLFLAWVGWVLIGFNPFGVVSRTGMGHNRFTNGQIQAYRRELYTEIWPHQTVKDRILEDVMIGRLMAQRGKKVEIANLSAVMSVKMYDTWRETLDGMSKNSYEVGGSAGATILIALVMLILGWAWLLCGSLWCLALGLLAFSGLCVGLTVRTVLWPVLLMPLIPTIAAYTLIRSLIWRIRGTVTWKGRIYS